jgi:hypothetical protein
MIVAWLAGIYLAFAGVWYRDGEMEHCQAVCGGRCTHVTPVEHVYPLVRSQKQLDRVLDEIEDSPGIVLFTLLEKR